MFVLSAQEDVAARTEARIERSVGLEACHEHVDANADQTLAREDDLPIGGFGHVLEVVEGALEVGSLAGVGVTALVAEPRELLVFCVTATKVKDKGCGRSALGEVQRAWMLASV